MTKPGRNKMLNAEMMEKYLHSQGANLCNEGRFDEAVDALYAAISVKDQPYSRYLLSRAYLGKGDLEKALEQISHAITLNKGIPEYYYERKKLWLLKGDNEKARTDCEKAIGLDKNYERINEIYHAARVFRQTFFAIASEQPINRSKIRQKALCEAIHDYRELRRTIGDTIEASTCTLPCPAYCCHFSGETITHGLSIGPWKLLAIRNFFKDQRLPEKEFLSKIAFSENESVLELIPPHHMVREGGSTVVYFPARRKGALSEATLRFAPKDIHYNSLIWINKRARPCAFLQDKRCMIHDLGGEPSLSSCKEFFCMTGLVFIALYHFGAVTKERVASRPFDDLNRIAIEALLIIARELLEHSDLARLRKTMKTLLRKAIKGDEEGNKKQVHSMLKQYSAVKDQHEYLFAERKDKIKKAIDALFSNGF
jgi:tetratricopeptide (TPR) repeat protein